MTWIHCLDLFGTAIFAISGVLTAMQKKFDLVGTLIIGFVTALGGGTLRDVLIGRFPVGWVNNSHYLFAILAGYFIAYFFKNKVIKYKRSMFLFDTIGIGLFTILGIETTLNQEIGLLYSLIMGVISACFGGVIRDVLTNEIPLIFRKEIYALACFGGGIVYISLKQLGAIENLNIAFSIAIVILIRFLSVKYKWSLNLNNN